MGNEALSRLPAPDPDSIVSGAGERRSTRNRQSNPSRGTPVRTPYQRNRRRRNTGRARVNPISSGSPVNASGISPSRQASQPAPYTRRSASPDPDHDLGAPRPSTILPRNATPERDFDPELDLPDYDDTPGRTATNGVLAPLVRGAVSASPGSDSNYRRTPTSPTYGPIASSPPAPARERSETSPNHEPQEPSQEDPEEDPYDDDDPCRDVLIERDNLLIERDNLRAEALRFDAERFVFLSDIDRMREDRVDLNMALGTEQNRTRDLRRNAENAATTIHNLQGAMNDLQGTMHDLNDTNLDLRNERNATHREYERDAARLHRRANAAHREIVRLGGQIPETPDRLSVSPEIPPIDEDDDDDDPCREYRRERDDAVRENARLRDSLAIARINITRLQGELYEAGGRRVMPPREVSREPPGTPTHRPDRHRPTPGGPRAGGRVRDPLPAHVPSPPHGPLPPNTTPPGPVTTATLTAQDLAAQARAARQLAAQAALARQRAAQAQAAQQAAQLAAQQPATQQPATQQQPIVTQPPPPATQQPTQAQATQQPAQQPATQQQPKVTQPPPPATTQTATRRATRSTRTEEETRQLPDFLSPTTRSTRRSREEAATQAAAKPSGVSKKKPAKKGKGRKK
jgi:hypothetical protein